MAPALIKKNNLIFSFPHDGRIKLWPSEKKRFFFNSFFLSGTAASLTNRLLRYITNRLRMKDDEEEIVTDWKFAAMVIDRNIIMLIISFLLQNFFFKFSLSDNEIPIANKLVWVGGGGG